MRRQRARLGRLYTLSLLVLMQVLPASVLAHGGRPAVLGLVAATTQGAQVVVLNEGLAYALPQGWSYLCPSLWADNTQSSGKFPIARSADGIVTWIAGGDDLYTMKDGMVTPQGKPMFTRNDVIALGNDAKNVYALHLVGQSTEVVQLGSMGAPLWSSPDYWSAITVAKDGLHLARVAGDKQLEMVSLDFQGKELGRTMGTIALSPLDIQLHATGGHVYVTGTDSNMWVLGYFDAGMWHQVMTSAEAILGPQASAGGTLWISVGQKLGTLQGDMVQPSADTHLITCLNQWNDKQYVCSLSDLFWLTDMGIGEQVFGMEQDFRGPDPQLVPAAAKDDCDYQWVRYTVDAANAGLTFMDWPSMAAAGAGAAGAAAMSAAAGQGAVAVPTAGVGGMTAAVPVAASTGVAAAGTGVSGLPAAGAPAGAFVMAPAPKSSGGICSVVVPGEKGQRRGSALMLVGLAAMLGLSVRLRRRARARA